MLEEQAAPAPAPLAAPEAEVVTRRRSSPLRGILKFARRKPLGAVGFAMVFLLAAMTFGTPKAEFGTPSLPDRPFGFELGPSWMARYDDEDKFYDLDGGLKQYASPSSDHWFGTDKGGRDMYARIVVGARRSLFVGIWALVVATILGTAVGVVSGYFGRWVDTIVQRFMDALQSFPPLIALILIVSINPLTSGDKSSLLMTAVILGLVGIPSVQRITRGVVLSTREQQYVEAGRVIGATDLRIMMLYIIPNIMASIIVIFSTGIGVVILAEAALSFIVPEKVPTGTSWGLMLSAANNELGTNPYPGLFSAGAIAVAVLAFNLAGDALRDVLDPRLRLQ
jgi:ABC-type dipeptide/oligopeptide/nickel transport system permease subunit